MKRQLEDLSKELQYKIAELNGEINRTQQYGNPDTLSCAITTDFRPSVNQCNMSIKPDIAHFKKDGEVNGLGRYVFDYLD